jgi:regulator of RNase E activity RraA
MSTTDTPSAPDLLSAVVRLPIRGAAYDRATPEALDSINGVGSATACAKLNELGVTRTFVNGPRPIGEGQYVSGPALTLQFMPQREDVGSGASQEYIERGTALWAVLETVQPGDILVIQAYGSAYTGCLGDMLVRYFKHKGGAGIVVDGRIRDYARVSKLGVPIWCTGVTPNFASQAELFPWAYDVPVAVGGVLCLPGDIVVADDDGAVVVPQAMASTVADAARDHQEWEVFSRMRIDEGARLSDYYPLTRESRGEYENWRAENAAG